MSTIIFDNITKVFGKRPAVECLSLDVASGEFIALLGPSGCGKTTTLRLLAGFIKLDAGRILVDGEVFSSVKSTIPPERRGMSMLFQNYAIWPHKTVFENIAFGLRLRNVERNKLRMLVYQTLEVTRLSQLASCYPNQLSGGQQQRVALARAIVVEPRILLLDEPLSNLDAGLREELRDEIRRLHQATGLTMLYVTHDQAEALVLADRIVVMQEGKIQQVGTPEEIYERPATEFVARFIGRCNVLHGKLLPSGQVDIGGILITAINRAPDVRVGDEIAVTVRPHSLSLEPLTCTTKNSSNCFVARVEQQAYLGEFRTYTVCLENTSVRLSVTTSPHVSYQVGDRLYLVVPAEYCRVVKRIRKF